MGAHWIVRGIMLGGAIGALSTIFNISDNMFIAVGFGMVAGFFAGITRSIVERRRRNAG